jgi:hypothetical protein
VLPIEFNTEESVKAIKEFKRKKCMGTDNIPQLMLKDASECLLESLRKLFNNFAAKGLPSVESLSGATSPLVNSSENGSLFQKAGIKKPVILGRGGKSTNSLSRLILVPPANLPSSSRRPVTASIGKAPKDPEEDLMSFD